MLGIGRDRSRGVRFPLALPKTSTVNFSQQVASELVNGVRGVDGARRVCPPVRAAERRYERAIRIVDHEHVDVVRHEHEFVAFVKRDVKGAT